MGAAAATTPSSAAEKPSIFGAAKVKTTKAAAASDKEIVYIEGLEPKLLELQFLKTQIADLEAQLGAVTDEIKTIGKEEFVKLYQNKKTNPNTFYIKDGEGCIMLIPTDKYLSVKDEAAADSIRNAIGDDAVTVAERFYFNADVLERNQDAIEAAIGDATTISDADKANLLLKEVKYSIAKGFIDKFAQYGNDKIETVMDTVQPIIQLKNCGGKMEDGGELQATDLITTIYGYGGSLQPTNETVWEHGNHLDSWKGNEKWTTTYLIEHGGKQYTVDVDNESNDGGVLNPDYAAYEFNRNGGAMKTLKTKKNILLVANRLLETSDYYQKKADSEDVDIYDLLPQASEEAEGFSEKEFASFLHHAIQAKRGEIYAEGGTVKNKGKFLFGWF